MIEMREAWRTWVTPRPLRSRPIHRWFAFPHSFTGDLVDALIAEWRLTEHDHILDPFAGAGTTILAAKLRSIPATGYDLSPLATFVSKVKTRNYNHRRVESCARELLHRLSGTTFDVVDREYPDLVREALPNGILATFEGIDRAIASSPGSPRERDFFRLALIAIIPKYSRAVAAGGWLKWVHNCTKKTSICNAFAKQVDLMVGDLSTCPNTRANHWSASCADARSLPDEAPTYGAVITSPPYPNRHDYTRVFGVELMFAFLDWEKTRRLRYQSIHSHPESRPRRPEHDDYQPPRGLRSTLTKTRRAGLEPKIVSMLEGYFLDMHLCLRECQRVASPGAPIAFVVGNAQYAGCPLPVDTYLARIGQALGLKWEKTIAVRLRGNSAQQMGRFGRHPSRESIVVFRKA
ncbi:MAG: hypothetical protein NTW96_02345 [Planctomycetia bacterium]|nr:hypothetical protein [Planctomycetia bacterium]